METFPIHVLTEADLDSIVHEAGGVRAHPNADRRTNVGADYIVGTTVLELKMLDEEGFNKPQRQAKLAELFRKHQPNRPVVILDPQLLPEIDQRKYCNIVEQPLKAAITKSRQQLAQSRSELADTTGSVLWIFNNGYMALDHVTLEDLIANRIRQDTTTIDGVIVSGCYYFSDGFDSAVLWPCSYIPIRADRPFSQFDRLKTCFGDFAKKYMTALMKQTSPSGDKFEVRDVVFDIDGIRYIRPAPNMGHPSHFYFRGRPRLNSSGIDNCPPVALTVPSLTSNDYNLVASIVDATEGPLSNYASWQRYVADATNEATPLQPLVAVSVDVEKWLYWCRETGAIPALDTLTDYANEKFEERIQIIIGSAREHKKSTIILSNYILAVTQEIGQDRANDVSDIACVREWNNGQRTIRPLAENMRIFHEHAIALASAYAIHEGVDCVQWTRKRLHGWH